MATVYRVVRLRADGAIVSIECTFHHPGAAKGALKRARQSIGHNSQGAAVKAEIQQMSGEWVPSASLSATKRNPAPVEESADPNRTTTFSKRDDIPLPGMPKEGNDA